MLLRVVGDGFHPSLRKTLYFLSHHLPFLPMLATGTGMHYIIARSCHHEGVLKPPTFRLRGEMLRMLRHHGTMSMFLTASARSTASTCNVAEDSVFVNPYFERGIQSVLVFTENFGLRTIWHRAGTS